LPTDKFWESWAWAAEAAKVSARSVTIDICFILPLTFQDVHVT